MKPTFSILELYFIGVAADRRIPCLAMSYGRPHEAGWYFPPFLGSDARCTSISDLRADHVGNQVTVLHRRLTHKMGRSICAM